MVRHARKRPRATQCSADRDLTMAEGHRLESDLNLLLSTTGDRAEGIAAFFDKRAPDVPRRMSTTTSRRPAVAIADAAVRELSDRLGLPPVDLARPGAVGLLPPGVLLRAADGWVHPGPPTVWADFTTMVHSIDPQTGRRLPARSPRSRGCLPR